MTNLDVLTQRAGATGREVVAMWERVGLPLAALHGRTVSDRFGRHRVAETLVDATRRGLEQLRPALPELMPPACRSSTARVGVAKGHHDE